jgi:hypothetical protein
MSKSSKRRPCPALSRDISAADCGEQRQSRLACPETCPHNPFAPANYSQLLETEDRLDRKTMERFYTLAPDPEALQREISNAKRKGIHAAHVLHVWNLFFATDSNQTTFAKRWEQSGFRELKNDERVLIRGKMQMRIALVEIHRILAGGRIEAVELLSPGPEPLILQDLSLAGMAARFSTLLAWIYPQPHYWRLSGTAITIPDVPDVTAPEIVREIVRHLGGPITDPEIRLWLAEHFLEFDASQLAVGRLRRQQMLAQMDAKFGKAVYDLRATFSQCRKRLDALPDVERDDLNDEERSEGMVEARVWFDDPPGMKQLTPPGGKAVLGRILLGQTRWRLEAMGSERLTRLRLQFERRLGDRVRFSGERVDDLGVRMSAKEPTVDQSLAPPRLLENPSIFSLTSSRLPAPATGVSPKDTEAEWMRAAERAFLDDHIPALSNLTPREAANDPVLRPKLVQLMKERVRLHDERTWKPDARMISTGSSANSI